MGSNQPRIHEDAHKSWKSCPETPAGGNINLTVIIIATMTLQKFISMALDILLGGGGGAEHLCPLPLLNTFLPLCSERELTTPYTCKLLYLIKPSSVDSGQLLWDNGHAIPPEDDLWPRKAHNVTCQGDLAAV